jgi:hypothetical protein
MRRFARSMDVLSNAAFLRDFPLPLVIFGGIFCCFVAVET